MQWCTSISALLTDVYLTPLQASYDLHILIVHNRCTTISALLENTFDHICARGSTMLEIALEVFALEVPPMLEFTASRNIDFKLRYPRALHGVLNRRAICAVTRML